MSAWALLAVVVVFALGLWGMHKADLGASPVARMTPIVKRGQGRDEETDSTDT